MILIDTHAHLYLNDFDEDRDFMIQRAREAGVKYCLLPYIDSETETQFFKMCRQFPDYCLPMMGLHPTSVKENWESELAQIENHLKTEKFVAIGEVGIDLYWDKTYQKEQETVLRKHIDWALEYHLPMAIHTRNSLDETLAIFNDYRGKGLTGVFHCFPGNEAQARQVINLGFYLGLGGVVSYKNAEMGKVAVTINLDHIVLETDAPFLSPAPKRGMRNESAFVYYVARKIAELKGVSIEEVAEVTTKNALQLFNLE